jgi:hypothetical protein
MPDAAQYCLGARTYGLTIQDAGPAGGLFPTTSDLPALRECLRGTRDAQDAF